MPYVFKHPKSPYYSAWFTDENGQRTSRSTKQSDRREALKQAIAWEDAAKQAREGTLTANQVLKVHNQMLAKSGQKVTAQSVEVFGKRWIAGKKATRSDRTAETYEPIIDGFIETLGSRRLAPMTAIGPPDIEKHRDVLTEQKKKPSTIRQSLKVISAMFNAAKKQGVVESNPVPAVEVDESSQETREPFTPEEVSNLLQQAKGEWKTLILLSAYAGMRLGDAVKLQWDNIDLTNRMITYTPEKTSRKGRIVLVPMHAAVYDHLMQLAGDSVGFVSPNLVQTGTGGRSGLSRQFKDIMEAAAISNWVVAEGGKKGRTQFAKSFHSLRHFFNSALTNAGVDEKIRMDMSGHSTASVNRRYSHVEIKSLREAVEKIP